VVLGSIEVQIRADVDEQLAPRVKAGQKAIGYLQGDASHPNPLQFVRIEPYVIPKGFVHRRHYRTGGHSRA
jgi:hypothetical protein